MNKVINKYIVFNFSKILLLATLIFFCLGIILNLFEEIEYFKKYNTDLILPFILTLSFLPDLIINLLPFIIFLSAIWFFRSIKLNKDLLSLKVFGLSNFDIAKLSSSIAFIFGIIVIVAINPITSSLLQYYEITKARYSDEVNHLISFNKNGIWIKDQTEERKLIVNAESLDNEILKDVTIYTFLNDDNLLSRVNADSVDISNMVWILKDAKVFDFENSKNQKYEVLELNTNYDILKINSIFKNTRTLSFFNLVNNYHFLIKRGYNEEKLKERIHSLLSLPVYLVLMVLLAAIFILSDMKKTNNISIFFVSIFTCVAVYYLKDLSMALGQTGKINLLLSIWIPIIILSIFSSIGIIQINEK